MSQYLFEGDFVNITGFISRFDKTESGTSMKNWDNPPPLLYDLRVHVFPISRVLTKYQTRYHCIIIYTFDITINSFE